MPVPQMAVVAPKLRSRQSHVGHGSSRDVTESMAFTSSSKLRHWDGTKRACTSWDGLRKDYDLWVSNGNCLVYLHSNEATKDGHSAKRPVFKIPFSLLLTTKCYPLIERFLVINKSEERGFGTPRTPGEMHKWHRLNPNRTVELYMPAPPFAEKKQVRRHQLLVRNFFAWVLRRPLVGEELGEALIGLLNCMHEYRSGVKVDNTADMTAFLDEKGYLCLTGQPDHALAVLQLAEKFCIKDLYLQALAHCVGMRDMLSSRRGFQQTSSATRTLIHEKGDELKTRLNRASTMLSDFLEEELSETHLGIPMGLRAHLERFRSFLLSFYATSLGYYPPRSFDASTYRALARDFNALYNLLVDEAYSSSEAMPSVAAGGICTLQLIQSFDTHSNFEPMDHPLPKLPHSGPQPRTKRMAWLSRSPKQRADDRQLGHVALVTASNWKQDSFENNLVRAYRNFEEDCALARKRLGKHERVSLVDGRKVRWILIYAIRQTLRYAAQRPPSVRDDLKARYLVTIAKDTMPPWQDRVDSKDLLRSQTEPALNRPSKMQETEMTTAVDRLEIKPDIDYFALTHREDSRPPRSRRASLPPLTETPVVLSRTSSLKQVLSRSSTIRRSVRRLKQSATSTSAPQIPMASNRPLYREIVVHGYGNGTNDVHLEPDAVTKPPPADVGRSASTASETTSSNISTVPSSASMADTIESSLSPPTLQESPMKPAAKTRRWSSQDAASASSYSSSSSPPVSSAVLSKSNSLKRRPISSALESYTHAARAFGQFVDSERRSIFANGRQNASEPKRNTPVPQSRSLPLSVFEDDIVEEPYILPRDSGDWTAMQEFLDGKEAADGGAVHAWEQYADLGGLTEVR
ncbi:hypothetical protein ED733_004627 [Metarhizium rileyi]|uniref:DUF8004 domain-containing protein n=1 Tax=Metarhizium rileyi (strain RCEF 4871) TaxID=1649241 RepID=A0A5C6GA97_METRR|nr:hypothetical protein ED733_004627 [Metarhizium rileyi]